MSAPGAKEVLYIYNGNEATAEVEFDADGQVPEPPHGCIMKRNGRQWKVSRTRVASEGSEPRGMPVLRIDLTNQF